MRWPVPPAVAALLVGTLATGADALAAPCGALAPKRATVLTEEAPERSPGGSEEAARALEAQLDGMGAERSCEVGPTPFGRGLVATRDLAPGAEALRIPLSCAMAEPADGGGEEAGLEDTWAGRLAMRVLERQLSGGCPHVATFPDPPPTPARGDWPTSALDAFDDAFFREEIDAAFNWRYAQWEAHCQDESSRYELRDSFLGALDLVCSRTFRVGSSKMLVPLIDMANHASRPGGGGHHHVEADGDSICLLAGDRGVRRGEEVTLDYGSRRNEDWILHYGFVPDRNTEGERIRLSGSARTVSWDDVGTDDAYLREECQLLYREIPTSIEEDLLLLRDESIVSDFRRQQAINHRLSRKMLLSAIIGEKAASPKASFFSFAEQS